MRKSLLRSITFLPSICALLLLLSCQKPTNHFAAWETYKGDPASTSYSSLDQINKHNVHRLEIDWTFSPQDAPEGSRFPKYECNPIVVDGTLYATSAQRWLYAVDPGTGQELWSFDPFYGEKGGGICRGVTYWQGHEEARILFTADHWLYAVDAKSGKAKTEFGMDGRIDLNADLGVNPDSIWVRPTSPGIIYQNLLIIGGEVSEVYGAAPGHIRAYDVRTGKLVWTFHTIPQPGEVGYETWPPDAWKYVGGANNWGGMCLDVDRGIVYAPLGSPTYDFYGADRLGMNLFGNSLVALDAATGERKWHFQTIHHDIWDYDLPAPPTLLTLEKEGVEIDAIALPSKVGFLYVFDRVTGEPIFPIDEKPVPASRVPGEEAWPTQPFPRKPKPYARQKLSREDLTKRSPELHQEAVDRLQSLRYEGLFTPPDPQGALLFPGTRGGSEWGGAAVDPLTGWIFINTNESPEVATVRQSVQDREAGQSLYNYGVNLYSVHCGMCHGKDLGGAVAGVPALDSVSEMFTAAQLVTRIREGSGRMPSFAHLPDEAITALVAFLKKNDTETAEKQHDEIATNGNDFRNTTAYGFFNLSDGLQAMKPPWGTLHAIDLHTGTYEWSIPLGENLEALNSGDQPTGTYNYGGPVITAGGLLFIAATKDPKMRAFDKSTGQLLWEYDLPGPGYASPSTYMHHGRQYLVISVTQGKEQPEGSIIAFALP